MKEEIEKDVLFTISDFGNDTDCSSIEELVENLSKKYNNNSISVHDKRGFLTKVIFVDVCDSVFTDSYTNETITFK